MAREFAKLPDEFHNVEEFEIRGNLEINDVPEEFPEAKEFDFDQEFNSNIVSNDDDDDTTSSVTSLKTTYTKALKVLKLATTVSLAATTTSVALPKIVPIITVDATEDESNVTTKADTKTENEIFAESAGGEWNISDIKRYIIIDGEEREDTSLASDGDVISYVVENESGKLYLSTYINNELSNTTELTKDGDGNYSCHLIRQSGAEVDILVYLENDSLVIKETGTTVIDETTYDTVTYYHCTKGSSTYYVTPDKEDATVVTTEKLCPVCDGEGTIKCGTCDGTGLVECTECNGTGYLNAVCTDCAGSGNCKKCDGTGLVKTSSTDSETGEITETEESCPECEGSGICATCNGSGKEKCPTCNNSDNANPGYVNCTDCNGSGRVTCTECNGSGRIEVSEEENSTEETSVSEEEVSDKGEDTENNETVE